MNCDTCKYCQIRYVKRSMDNTFRCRIQKFKECYDPEIENFSIYTHAPSWCPLLKKAENNVKEG